MGMLSSSLTYNAFINHLSKEYSIECLLSLTEMIQFREYLIHKLYSKGFEDDKLRIVLASDIPKSYIVENKQWDDKEKAYLLYTKYIRSGAELQINIPAEQRLKYDQLMGNYIEFMGNGTISNMELIKRNGFSKHQFIQNWFKKLLHIDNIYYIFICFAFLFFYCLCVMFFDFLCFFFKKKKKKKKKK